MSGDTTVTDSSTLSSLASPAPATSTSWQNEVCKGPHHDFNSSFLRHNSGQGIGKLQKYRLSYSGHKSCISQDARLNFARLFTKKPSFSGQN